MHANEGMISDNNNTVIKKWNHFLTNKKSKFAGKLMYNLNEIAMWNAGVIGLNSNKAHLLKEVLSITDFIYPVFSKHTVEQFVFSYVFQKNGVIFSAKEYIFHYWDLKEFRFLLRQFYEINKGVLLKELERKIKHVLPEPIMHEKLAYKNLPFYKKIFTNKWRIDRYTNNIIKNSI
jgi:hypothetical protein